MNNFGQNRVIEPKGVFPVSAWRLDNSKQLNPGEMRISVQRIKLEEGSFRQLCHACDYNKEKIIERIMTIIDRRGKLHNQLSDSGGICFGTVEDIDPQYKNSLNPQVGDKVMGIVSLTSIPLHIESIESINFNYGQIEVRGYGIFFSTSPVVAFNEGLPEEILLCAYDESGSIAKAGQIAQMGNKFLILGSNILTVLIYVAAMKLSNNGACTITTCLDLGALSLLEKNEIETLFAPYVNKVYMISQTSPMENYKIMMEENGILEGDNTLFDSSIVCSNMLGMETLGVLLTKNHGNLFFTNLINNYNLTILFAESLGKSLNTMSLEEYKSDFPVFTTDILNKIKDNLLRVHELYKKNNIINRFPNNSLCNFNIDNIVKIDGYIFVSDVMRELLEHVLNIAKYDCNVMILGETGVGKERIFDIIYKNSSRNKNHCVKINCSAITENLAESEFFGYETGAFTGAKNMGKKGFFEMANNGILFLDEVGDLPMNLQAKLLRVLQEGQFYKVGGEKPTKVNVRVICATNKSLRQMVEEGKFRADLFYRLSICEIDIPPLRERIEDLEPLVELFIGKYNEKYIMSKTLTMEAFDFLKEYEWPGNIRELDNTIHKLLINTKGDIIDDKAIENILTKTVSENNLNPETSNSVVPVQSSTSKPLTLGYIMGQHERVLIKDTLAKHKTTRAAAIALGISQSQLMRKKKKYNL